MGSQLLDQEVESASELSFLHLKRLQSRFCALPCAFLPATKNGKIGGVVKK